MTNSSLQTITDICFVILDYRLDYNELYRDLKDIFVISSKGVAFDYLEQHKQNKGKEK
jgi:hypothetical protein